MPEVSKTEEFLAVADQFKLGELVTETCHPKTGNLSTLVQNDETLLEGLRVLQEIDIDALEAALDRAFPAVDQLADAVSSAFAAGDRVFLSGCGATGRLAMSLEVIARDGFFGDANRERVIGFTAGGDSALIKAIESFEDRPEYTIRHMAQLGYKPTDLMVGITEGGETPFVLSAVETALADGTTRTPWLVYCNPDDQLCRIVERSRLVIENPAVQTMNLTCGPMGISGSTRMQATTVQQWIVGTAMWAAGQPGMRGDALKAKLSAFIDRAKNVDWTGLADLTKLEADHYKAGGRTTYVTAANPIAVLTDTTERSPTFSVLPFENTLTLTDVPCLCYLSIPGTDTPQAAWEALLRRSPRCLDWDGPTATDRLMGFDISAAAVDRRAGCMQLTITEDNDRLSVSRDGVEVWGSSIAGLDLLERHLVLKMALNAHSTSVMGRLGRYSGCTMTWVRASNNKLIDRASRYVTELLRQRGLRAGYGTVAAAVIEAFDVLAEDVPIVQHVADQLTKELGAAVTTEVSVPVTMVDEVLRMVREQRG